MLRRGLFKSALLMSFAHAARSLVVPPRTLLPSRPSPSKPAPTPLTEGPTVLDGSRLVDMARVGATAISPDGSLACFEVRQYDWSTKKFDAQLWLADLPAVLALRQAHRFPL